MAKKVNGVVHNMYNNATDSGGYAIPPLATNLALGQLVVNTSESDPCVLFKTSAGKIVKIVSEEVITKALTDILGNSAADLDTLRELIAQFEGSANDILPMLVALTDRVSAAETALGNKANSSVVNAHISNTSNPHGVTKAQVGLSNLRNVEQLGITETAVAANRIGPTQEFNDANAIGSNSGFAGFHATNVTTESSNYPETSGVALTYVRSPQTVTSSNRKLQLFSQCGNNELFCRFGYGTGSAMGHSNWFKIWHDGNSNKSDVPWACRELVSSESIRNKAILLRGNSSYVEIAPKFTDTTDTTFEWHNSLRYYPKANSWSIGNSTNILFHGGNSNKPDVDWRANNLYLTGSIYNTVDNNQWLYHVKRSDNTQVRGIASDGWDLQLITNNIAQLIIKSGGNAGFGTNNPTDRIHAVGNVRATEKVIAGGNVESNGSGIFAGDILAKKSGAVVFSANDQAVAGATRLNDLQDVKLPANLSAKMIMAYDPAQINADGTTGGYTFMPAVGVGTGKVVADDIESLPDLNLIGSTYVAASDKRLKDNIRPLVGATNILLNFAAKEYEWNEEGRKLGLTDPRAYGLIAQEAAELKDIVDIVRPMGTSDYLGVDYVKIVPILIAGFQEQQKEIGTVNRKIEAIRLRANKAYGLEDANAKKIETLESEVRELKRLMSN